MNSYGKDGIKSIKLLSDEEFGPRLIINDNDVIYFDDYAAARADHDRLAEKFGLDTPGGWVEPATEGFAHAEVSKAVYVDNVFMSPRSFSDNAEMDPDDYQLPPRENMVIDPTTEPPPSHGYGGSVLAGLALIAVFVLAWFLKTK